MCFCSTGVQVGLAHVRVLAQHAGGGLRWYYTLSETARALLHLRWSAGLGSFATCGIRAWC